MLRSQTFRNRNIILFYLIIALLGIYLLLFELLFPVNYILPKPSIFWESGHSLFKDYDLFINIVYTASGVYFSILIGYLLISGAAGIIGKFLLRFNGIISPVFTLRYVPVLAIIALFVYWFPDSKTSEYIFTVLFVLSYFLWVMYAHIEKRNFVYEDVALTLGMNEKTIFREIIWKTIQPGLFASIKKLHFLTWSVMLLFEYVKYDMGVGTVYRRAVEYKDISALTVIIIINCLLLFIAHAIYKKLQNRLIYWE